MRISKSLKFSQIKFLILFLLFNFFCFSQDIQVEIVGGAIVYEYDIIAITAGNAMTFRITNTKTNCANLRIEDLILDPSTGFIISHENLPKNIKPEDCRNGNKYLDFTVTNVSGNCSNSTDVIIEMNSNNEDFIFTFTLNGSPEINVLGGNPFADIIDGDTTTTATNGTYFGVVEEGMSISRNFIITSTGSCPLDVTAITSSLGDFTIAPFVLLPDYSQTVLPNSVDPGSYIIFIVTFTAPATPGTYTSTISISNNDNTTFTFDVSAEIFDFTGPQPGGISADFRLWLKGTRGVYKGVSPNYTSATSGDGVSFWEDIGTNGKDATQTILSKQPTYLDSATDNINFNPVINFENNGTSIEQYLENTVNGFYSQDIFIVMVPDATITNTSERNTIFAGIDSGGLGDMTGIGFGDYSSEFINETLSYNQDIPGTSTYNGEAEISSSYANAGIINVRNNADISPTGQDILYNSSLLTTSNVSNSFSNVGDIDTDPDPDVVFGTKYWIGRNFDVPGSLNGRVAEIFTFAERVGDADRRKIESYLAIKYGITLGTSIEAQKNYINSFDSVVWDITADSGAYNFHVAGIGRDDDSDLNQKQSKTVNTSNEVTIGLGGIFTKNSSNTNEFNEDGNFLVWGCNNDAFSGSNLNSITIAAGITTSLTRIDRKWKIVESNKSGSGGDVEDIYISIPYAAFSSFTLGADEEYALIVADNDGFSNTDIIDVIPLKSDGAGNLLTWYDFDGTKYFTFGKVSKWSGNRSISIASGDYLVGEYALNLNINDFTISAWVKAEVAQTSTRTIMAKGNKLQLRLNSSHQIEVMVDNEFTPRFISNMVLNDDKWHQISFVYNSGTIFLYVDGVLDKSEQNVTAPSPNYNRFSVGAIYVDKNTINNPFLGEIDEVYVWDQGLTQYQVRYLMNQEIEKVTGDMVSGKIIPSASASNEVATIPWSKLKGYYDFNSFYGSAVEGLTNNRNFLRLKYLNKDKQITDEQTAPLPYVSTSNGDWDTGATWNNNADQIIPNTLSLDGITIIDWNIVQISHDIASGDRDISLLGLIQTGGKLTIEDPVVTDPVENNAGQGLIISHYLEIDGIIDLVGKSQLVQSEGSILDADSGGFIERDQQGTANSYNYNYWSSSVGPIGGNTAARGTGISHTNENHTIDGVLNDGTTSDSYEALAFSTSYSAADSSTPSVPRTISTYWLHKFYGPEDDYNAWTKFDETSDLLPGEGFTMKGTSGSIDIASNQNYVFKGLPNNGDITLGLDNSSEEVARLIGNPYPSAIDATEFILDNLSIADGGNNTTGTVINGALYFWDHFGEQNSHILKSYVGGYATRNLTGGAVAISNDGRISNPLDNFGDPLKGTKIPGQYIAVNQGFFVSTKLSGFDNDNGTPILAVDGGDIVFKNSQRVFAPEDDSTSTFMRTGSTKLQVSTSTISKKKTPLIKILYNSPEGYHRQIVLGAKEKASSGFDIGYDALMADVNEEDMYWLINNNKFVIQGVHSFAAQEYPLGLIVKNGGIAKIKMDALENMNSDLTLYIKDELTGVTHNIIRNAFEIHLDKGIYNDRFKLVFQLNENKENEIEPTNIEIDLVKVVYESKSSELTMINKENILVKDMMIYNIQGSQIKNVRLNSKTNVTVHVSAITGLYIVKLNTEKGVVTKKIIID